MPSDRKLVLNDYFLDIIWIFLRVSIRIGVIDNKLDVRKWLPTILLVRQTNTVAVRAQSQEWIEGTPGT